MRSQQAIVLALLILAPMPSAWASAKAPDVCTQKVSATKPSRSKTWHKVVRRGVLGATASWFVAFSAPIVTTGIDAIVHPVAKRQVSAQGQPQLLLDKVA